MGALGYQPLVYGLGQKDESELIRFEMRIYWKGSGAYMETLVNALCGLDGPKAVCACVVRMYSIYVVDELEIAEN